MLQRENWDNRQVITKKQPFCFGHSWIYKTGHPFQGVKVLPAAVRASILHPMSCWMHPWELPSWSWGCLPESPGLELEPGDTSLRRCAAVFLLGQNALSLQQRAVTSKSGFLLPSHMWASAGAAATATSSISSTCISSSLHGCLGMSSPSRIFGPFLLFPFNTNLTHNFKAAQGWLRIVSCTL